MNKMVHCHTSQRHSWRVQLPGTNTVGFPSVFFNLMLTIETPDAAFIYVLQQDVIKKVQILRNALQLQPGKD